MKCPICHASLIKLAANKRGCPNSSALASGHAYHNSDNGGFLVESYIYKGWRIHTAPIHPALGIPLTSFYRFDYLTDLSKTGGIDTPDYELPEYMPPETVTDACNIMNQNWQASHSTVLLN